MNNATWSFPATGMWWSLIAGIVGAIGAFGVLLAFGAAPKPVTAYVPVIMAIIFAGAPIVNALVSISLHPPEGGMGAIKWPFWFGILLAAAGGGLVSKYKPDVPMKKPRRRPRSKPQVNVVMTPARAAARAACGDRAG